VVVKRRGTPRPGTGRPRGRINRLSAEAIAEAMATGELPHQFLLRVARGAKIGDYQPTFAERLDAAKAAAPYYAPKLSAIDARIEGEGASALNVVVVPAKAPDADSWLRWVNGGAGKAVP
jgi:hypothetical protein